MWWLIGSNRPNNSTAKQISRRAHPELQTLEIFDMYDSQALA
jgi:hypothetical protein